MDQSVQMILTAVISALSSSGVMTFIIFLIQRRDERKRREEANSSDQARMLVGLGHDKILYLTDKYVRRGSITLKEKRNLKCLYDPYRDLGGNGDCEIGYDACTRLPVVSDEEAEAKDIEIKRKEYNIETNE